jgi:hypothetical protein
VFLFLHTFRAHWPYRVSEAARRELAERLALGGDVLPLLDDVLAEVREQGLPGARMQDLRTFARSERMLALARALEAHYRGGAADLDRALGAFPRRAADERLPRLRPRRLHERPRRGVRRARRALPRRPAVRRAGAHPARDRGPRARAGAARRAGLARRPRADAARARGRARARGLAGPLAARAARAPPAVRLRVVGAAPDSSLFVLEDARKVLLVPRASAAPSTLGAFDLATDPAEERDQQTEAWPAELLERRRGDLARALAPLFRGESVVLDPEAQSELRELGY